MLVVVISTRMWIFWIWWRLGVPRASYFMLCNLLYWPTALFSIRVSRDRLWWDVFLLMSISMWIQHSYLFWPDIDIFKLTRCVKLTVCSFLEWNQYPCCQTLTWNQHFNLFWPDIDIFELKRCTKLIFWSCETGQPSFSQGLMWN